MPGWVEAFIVIAAVAIFLQMAILAAMFFQVKTAIEKFTRIAVDFQERVNPILLRTSRILDDSETRIASIMGDTADITRIARGQAHKVDRVFTEAVERLRIQVIRADQILTGAMEVVEETGDKFRSTVWGPIKQASAVMKGIKVGLDFLRNVRGERRSAVDVEGMEQDEELFI
jgi:5-hydroxyisourate hydrolase-like protein (transthyretin family)